MTRKELLAALRKRAGDPARADRYVSALDAGTLALTATNAVAAASIQSAVFVITDASIDRDGDRVHPLGIRWDNWHKAGAPVFWGHQEGHPYPIGSCLNPDTGHLDVWVDRERARARVYFDMDDELSRFIARKVAKGLCRSVSVAFVPIRATPRHAEAKAQRWGGSQAGGWDFAEVDLTELSLVGIGSNPHALLQGATPAVAKAIRKCLGCRGPAQVVKAATQADLESSPEPPAAAPGGSGDANRAEILDRYPHEDEPMKLPHVLAALYAHAKAEAAYLDQLDETHKDTLADYRSQHLDERMDLLKGMFGKEAPDEDLDQLGKAFETDFDQSRLPTGEANLVGRGDVPPEREERSRGRRVSPAVERKFFQLLHAFEKHGFNV